MIDPCEPKTGTHNVRWVSQAHISGSELSGNGTLVVISRAFIFFLLHTITSQIIKKSFSGDVNYEAPFFFGFISNGPDTPPHKDFVFIKTFGFTSTHLSAHTSHSPYTPLLNLPSYQSVCLLLQDLLQSCSRGGRIVEDMCYESVCLLLQDLFKTH